MQVRTWGRQKVRRELLKPLEGTVRDCDYRHHGHCIVTVTVTVASTGSLAYQQSSIASLFVFCDLARMDWYVISY